MYRKIYTLTKHSLVYGFGYIITRSIGFVLLPVHTNYLTTAEYGVVGLLFASLAILNVIYRYGIDVAFLRFFIMEEEKAGKKRIFSTAFISILVSGIFFSIIINVFPQFLSQTIFQDKSYVVLIRLASGILIADALTEIPFRILRAEERSFSFCLLKFLNVAANFSLNIIFIIHLKKGIEGVFLANLISSVFTLITVFPIVFKWVRLSIVLKILKDLLSFGIPYIPSLLSVIIMGQIGRFFLDRMVSAEATGIFNAGYKLGMFMSLVVTAFRFAWHPFFLSVSKEKNAKEIYAKVLTYFIIVVGFIFLTISFFLKEIVHIQIFGITLFGKKFFPGLSIVPIVMLAYVAYGVYINFIVGIYMKKKTLYLPLITGSGAIVAIISNFILVPLWGIFGAAISTFIAYLSMAVILYIINQKLYKIDYEFSKIFKIIILYALIYCIGTIFFSNLIMVKIGILLSVVPFLWIFDILSKEEKTIIFSIFRKG
ncbi:MAG: oligosaccharide flippase family protein [bacterium]